MSSPQLIDSHCHLFYDYTPKTSETVLDEALREGVSHFINVGVEAKQIEELERVSDLHENIFHTVGVHPHEAKLLTDADIENFRKAAKHTKCVAIGEIGLDYYYNHSEKTEQISSFEKQLELALDVQLPVVIHGRDAEEDSLRILASYTKRVTSGQAPGVLHCFTGSRKFGQACIDLGFYISLSGILTFKTAEDLRVSAASFPLDRLLVETDSPFLAPIPFRGKKCEPKMIKQTALKLSEIFKLSFEEIVEVTRRNTIRAFNLPIS